MPPIEIYLILFGIIVLVGYIFNKSPFPISLFLVITGMLLSLVPGFPRVILNSNVVLNIFLPILIYQISTAASWQDVKKNLRPITLLSVGHVIFITCLVATIIHALIPNMGWPLSFVLGAVISPPDDVAIVSIAEKIRMPARIVTILEGEGMLNDATALILFRFALAAVATHIFSITHAIGNFFLVISGEIIYGLLVGYIMGEFRKKITNTTLHMLASLLTPFIAYFPAVMVGGCGVLATAVTGFVIGSYFAEYFTPQFRLVSRSVWPMLAFAIQSLIFLLVGLDMASILENIASISFNKLFLYSSVVILTVILGRFIWVYAAAYLPRYFFASVRKKDPYPPWQYPFVVSWAGMRGGISLAAALAVPALPIMIDGINPKDLLIFLVFSVIAATFLLQGLTLPWLLKIIGIKKYEERERYDDHINELYARLQMIKAGLRWLVNYKKQIKDNPELLNEVNLYIKNYYTLKQNLKQRITDHDQMEEHDEQIEAEREAFLLLQIIDIEKNTLLKLWHDQKINLVVRNKLLEQLDHRSRHVDA